MKKSLYTLGLMSMVMVLTSFTGMEQTSDFEIKNANVVPTSTFSETVDYGGIQGGVVVPDTRRPK